MAIRSRRGVAGTERKGICDCIASRLTPAAMGHDARAAKCSCARDATYPDEVVDDELALAATAFFAFVDFWHQPL